ncbi:putative serine dehydratase domain-containing protein [Podospora appendiculata]|uniref:D-serine dehydratase n=1 Tax=Podospora appendiculata TaxID=314037 RepID=A0AAE0XK02_9PEZI|nr:putative serine dehydratase domain-containing protein [Podospora appendiculata]
MAANTPSTDLKEQLKAKFVGQSLGAINTPAAVLDLAKVEVNCERMLDATDKLKLSWRAHIKSHKTTELTRLQIGHERTTPVSIITSTVIEAENILPLLQEYQSKGRHVNLLFAFPLFPSAVSRLACFASQLGPSSLSVMVDHPDQLASVAAIARGSGHPLLVFIKIDANYGRAGVVQDSPACARLIDAVLAAEQEAGTCLLYGVYCHAGQSYGAREDWAAMHALAAEFAELSKVAALVRAKSPGHPLVLSVGATPTATTIQHPTLGATAETAATSSAAPTHEIERLFAELKRDGFTLEVHAGVYPTLDLQQLATHARDSSLMTYEDIAISVLAEVASIYPGRGAQGTTEALINAGCLALGREPVTDKGAVPGRDFSGWGILMPWGGLENNPTPGPEFPRVHGGWQVGKVSQEHGILVWKGSKEDEVPLRIGQKVRVWPNHSCIAGACFDWYLVVDSRNKGREDEVVDVWPRWRGW